MRITGMREIASCGFDSRLMTKQYLNNMNATDLSIYNHLFTGSDFGYGPDERYCGHRVIDLRDGVVTARATVFKPYKYNPKTAISDAGRNLVFYYASKPLPGKAPELIEQKQAK